MRSAMFVIVTDVEVATSGLASVVVREGFAPLDLPSFLKKCFASLNIGLWGSIAVGDEIDEGKKKDVFIT